MISRVFGCTLPHQRKSGCRHTGPLKFTISHLLHKILSMWTWRPVSTLSPSTISPKFFDRYLSWTQSNHFQVCQALLRSACLAARIRLQHRRLRLSASIQATGFPVVLVLVHQQLVLLETEVSKSFLAVPI